MSRRQSVPFLMMLAIVALPAAQAPAEKIDLGMIAKIRDEGMTRSQVIDHIGWLSDVYGPRLTGGPGIMQASEWTLKTLAEWGLANPHRETFAFGKGWSLVRFSAHMIEPQIQPLIGFPGAWTPSTKGAVTAEVVRVDIETEADIEKYRGKLAGKIVLTQPARTVRLLEGPIVLRMTDKDFEEAKTIPPPRSRGGAGRGERGGEADEAGAAGDAGRGGRGGGNSLQQKIQQFYKSEGVVALLNRGGNSDMSAGGSDLSWQQQRPDGGTLFPSGGGSRGADAGTGCRR
jgi:carboxypeptidase Q